MRNERLDIGRMSATYGVSLRTLRFYEDRNLLHPQRLGNARLYSLKDQLTLELIQKAKKLGFSLSEIDRLIGVSSVRFGPAEVAIEPEMLMTREQVKIQLDTLRVRRSKIVGAIEELEKMLKSIA